MSLCLWVEKQLSKHHPATQYLKIWKDLKKLPSSLKVETDVEILCCLQSHVYNESHI